jgi:hypothetical protein
MLVLTACLPTDQIQDEMKTYDPEAQKPIDMELPGLGQ